MKYRIVKDLADFGELWYFPEYYVEPYFFDWFGGYWARFREWKGCDPLGFDYGYGDVYFKDKEKARKVIKDAVYKFEIVENL